MNIFNKVERILFNQSYYEQFRLEINISNDFK